MPTSSDPSYDEEERWNDELSWGLVENILLVLVSECKYSLALMFFLFIFSEFSPMATHHVAHKRWFFAVAMFCLVCICITHERKNPRRIYSIELWEAFFLRRTTLYDRIFLSSGPVMIKRICLHCLISLSWRGRWIVLRPCWKYSPFVG